METIDTRNLVAAEVAYIGSFIAGEREKDFYAVRDTIIHPDSMHDPISTAILTAVNIARQDDHPDTSIDNLTYLIIGNNLISKDATALDISTSSEELQKVLEHYKRFGAKTMKQFRQREIAVQENWRSEQISEENIIKLLRSLGKSGGTSIDKVMALRSHFDNLIGELPLTANTAMFDDQQKRLEELPLEMASMVGKPMKGFPPSWGLNKNIKRIRPGELILLMGGTGDGKSAMAMQFAEWRWAAGDNILVIHMEDKMETILMRQTLRWIGGTLEELEGGDPRGKMQQMAKLREKWKANGGQIIYKYLAGFSPQYVVDQIREVSRELHAQGKKLDGIVFDYFTKLNLDEGMKNGMNLASVASKAVDTFKRLAEKLDCYMLVVSQQTKEANGQTHAEMTTNLEKMSQVVLSIETHRITNQDEEEYVDLGHGEGGIINTIDDISVWRKLVIKKVNQGQRGAVWVYFEAPRFRVIEQQWAFDVRNGTRDEFEVPIVKPLTPASLARLDQYAKYYAEGVYQLKTPDEIKKERKKKND